MNLYDVIKKPVISEKSEYLRENLNCYVFQVDARANKKLVNQAIRLIYELTPKKVNIVNLRPKRKANRLGYGYTTRKKKAYVFLNESDKIEIFEGV